MQRLLLNGSPRGRHSNSRLILDWMREGFAEAGAGEAPILDLARSSALPSLRQTFLDAEEVLLVFPLYTDSMPGLVKGFFELLLDARADQLRGKRLAFVVQSGFPEAIHGEAVAAYLARLCARLGFVHAGTIVMGGAEGIRIRPAWQTRKLRAAFARAGRELVVLGRFSDPVKARLAGRRTFGPVTLALLTLASRLGLTNVYWDMMLKKHGAFARRFDAPYGEPAAR